MILAVFKSGSIATDFFFFQTVREVNANPLEGAVY